MKQKIAVLARGLLLGAVILGASATTLRAQVSPVSDWLRVYDRSGKVVYSVEATEADELANGPGFVYSITDPTLVLDTTQFGNYTAVMEGPGSTVLSDVFGISSDANGVLSLSFMSDTDTPNGSIPGFAPPYPNVVYETGGPDPGGIFDATRYLATSLQQDGFTAQFASDPVPEPATVVTSLVTLLAAGGFGLRRHLARKTAS